MHGIKITVDVKNSGDVTRNNGAAQTYCCESSQIAKVCFGTTYPSATPVTQEHSIGNPPTRLDPVSVSGNVCTRRGRKVRSVKCCKNYAICDRKSGDTYPA